MIASVTNHLLQSSLFSLFALIIALLLSKNSAGIRYWVWFSASLKFLIPFSIFMNIGTHLQALPGMKGISAPISQTVAPVITIVSAASVSTFSAAGPQHHIDWIYASLFGLWACGTAVITFIRVRAWRRIQAIVRGSKPAISADVSAPSFQTQIPIRAAKSVREPGVVGLWRPLLLVPVDIEKHLTPLQWQTLLAHELCHVRRRDNLTATVQMVVEAIFWFHPLVWWIGSRLLDERERACDEHVLEEFKEPRAYAQGILNLCKLYAESPLACVSGISGSTNIKRRIEDIMNGRVGRKLTFTGKAALTLTATLVIAVPIGIGVITAPLHAEMTNLTCSPSDPAIQLELQSADDQMVQADASVRRRTIEKLAQQVVDRHPDNFIVHIRYQQWMGPILGPHALAERYKSLAVEHAGDPKFEILYAQALRATDASQAKTILMSVPSSSLDSWVHLTLAELYSWSPSKDLPLARTQLDAWFTECPATLNWNALSSLVEYGSSATAAKEAAILRAELEQEIDPHLLLSWPFVWALEAKARPASEQAALRQQIALDVARLESIPTPDDKRWPNLLMEGHQLAGDPTVR